MQPSDLAFHEGLTDWIPLSEVAGVTIGGASPAQPPLPEPEGVSAVSTKPDNMGKILVFGGIGVGLIAVCIAVGFFVLGWGKKESPQKKAEGSTPKTTLPSPPSVKTNGNPVKPPTQPHRQRPA